MLQESTILRGDIRLCDFGTDRTHAIIKNRPVVVLQNNIANKHSQNIIVAIIRSNPKVEKLPVGVRLEPGVTGLDHTSFVDLGHIYTIDREKIQNKIGMVPGSEMEKINKAIRISLDIEQQTL